MTFAIRCAARDQACDTKCYSVSSLDATNAKFRYNSSDLDLGCTRNGIQQSGPSNSIILLWSATWDATVSDIHPTIQLVTHADCSRGVRVFTSVFCLRQVNIMPKYPYHKNCNILFYGGFMLGWA